MVLKATISTGDFLEMCFQNMKWVVAGELVIAGDICTARLMVEEWGQGCCDLAFWWLSGSAARFGKC